MSDVLASSPRLVQVSVEVEAPSAQVGRREPQVVRHSDLAAVVARPDVTDDGSAVEHHVVVADVARPGEVGLRQGSYNGTQVRHMCCRPCPNEQFNAARCDDSAFELCGCLSGIVTAACVTKSQSMAHNAFSDMHPHELCSWPDSHSSYLREDPQDHVLSERELV